MPSSRNYNFMEETANCTDELKVCISCSATPSDGMNGFSVPVKSNF